jgi:hypothetical protein
VSALVTVHDICQDCEEPFLPFITGFWFDEISEVCADCESNRGEAAEQRALSDFYGGSGPATERERQMAAWEEKRRLS